MFSVLVFICKLPTCRTFPTPSFPSLVTLPHMPGKGQKVREGGKGSLWISPSLCFAAIKTSTCVHSRFPEASPTAPVELKVTALSLIYLSLRGSSQVSPSNRKQILPREQKPLGQAVCLSHLTSPEPQTPGILLVGIHPAPETQMHIQS